MPAQDLVQCKSIAARLRTGLLLLVVLLTGGVACRSTQEADVPRLTYRLKWLFNVSSAGELYAEAQGIFRDYGLDVTIKAGGPERDAIKELEIGHAQFGVASADQVIRALAKGAPLVVLAQLFQINPLQWIYRPAQLSMADPAHVLPGKTIGVTYGGNDETIMRTLLAQFGIAAEAVALFSVRYDYTPFYQRQVDLWPVYVNAQGVILADRLAQAGEDTAFFNPHAAGVRFVANSVVTTQKLLAEQPDLVERFCAALLEGWRQAMDPAQEQLTLGIIQGHDRDTPREIIARQLAMTRRLVLPTGERGLGTIDVAAWQETEAIMLGQGLIAAPVHVEKVLWKGGIHSDRISNGQNQSKKS